MDYAEGRMVNIDGHLYEQRSVNRVLVRTYFLGIEGGRIAYAKAGQTRQKFHDVMTSAVREARITREEYVDLSEADAIIRGRNHRHAVVEISLGADEDDISRALRRAQTLQAAIGETVVPVVATPNPHPAFIQAAEGRNVQVLDVPA